MFGSGAIELLGREMTQDLLALKIQAISQAASSGKDVTVALVTKGVSFGSLTAHPDGSVDTSAVVGVNPDLVIRPFSRKGAMRSVREFSVNAFNQHHGMQAVERFGLDTDPDQDGVTNELRIGDITAATVFQTALPIPVQSAAGQDTKTIERGELLFAETGCVACHMAALPLRSTRFCDPDPTNPGSGPFKTFNDASQSVCFDLRKTSGLGADGMVHAYTDLKRHVICDADHPHYCNEPAAPLQPDDSTSSIPNDQFLTAKLWDVGNSAPYGHRGDLDTIFAAIVAHGGEAAAGCGSVVCGLAGRRSGRDRGVPENAGNADPPERPQSAGSRLLALPPLKHSQRPSNSRAGVFFFLEQIEEGVDAAHKLTADLRARPLDQMHCDAGGAAIGHRHARMIDAHDAVPIEHPHPVNQRAAMRSAFDQGKLARHPGLPFQQSAACSITHRDETVMPRPGGSGALTSRDAPPTIARMGRLLRFAPAAPHAIGLAIAITAAIALGGCGVAYQAGARIKASKMAEQLRPGMASPEVHRQWGEPDIRQYLPGDAEVWSYPYKPNSNDVAAMLLYSSTKEGDKGTFLDLKFVGGKLVSWTEAEHTMPSKESSRFGTGIGGGPIGNGTQIQPGAVHY